MRDPYEVLSVPRGASGADIKKAFRKLAKTWHPDKNPDDPKAKERFSEISAAYDLLSDEEKRGAFDRGEIDAEGKPRFQGFGAGGPGRGSYSDQDGFETFTWGPEGFRRGGSAGVRGFSSEDIFSDLFSGLAGGRGRQRAGAQATPGGTDIAAEVVVPFNEWARGGKVRMTLPSGRELDVSIPAGVSDGQVIRLKGQGEPSHFGGPPGDALITVKIAAHPQFKIDGSNLRVEVPVTLYEAVLGGKVRVPTPAGAVEVNVPARSTGTRTLRLKGKGIGAGDLLVSLKIVLPEGPDAELEALAKRMREGAPYDPRKNGT